jgi:hypothetical protein
MRVQFNSARGSRFVEMLASRSRHAALQQLVDKKRREAFAARGYALRVLCVRGNEQKMSAKLHSPLLRG